MLRGFYCGIEWGDCISAREAEAIRTRMEELVDAALTEGEAKIYGNRNN